MFRRGVAAGVQENDTKMRLTRHHLEFEPKGKCQSFLISVVSPRSAACHPMGGDNCASREFTLSDIGITMRFVIINLFDRVYGIRNGTGIGVGTPLYRLRCGCSSASQSPSDVLP
ncbi:MAG: hypothetical protein ACRESQ_00580 [Gammaproteobacteria bacterium]